MQNIGSTDNEGAASITKTLSGDLIIGGYKEDSALVVRTTPSGEVVWSKSFNVGPDADYINDIIISADNHIVLIGDGRNGTINPYGFCSKLDLSGNIVWTATFNAGSAHIWTLGITENGNNNFQVVGGLVDNFLDNYLVEIDGTTGVVISDNMYARSNWANAYDENFNDVEYCSSNSSTYAVGRFQLSAGFASYRPCLTKFDANGNLVWSKTYLYDVSPSHRLYSYGIHVEGDSIVMSLLGTVGGTNTPFSVGIMKTDLDGTMGWAKWYESPSNVDLRGYSFELCPNGYVISGWTNTTNKQYFLINTNTSGQVQWSKTYGGTGVEEIFLAVANASSVVDGNRIVSVGRTTSFSTTEDVFLMAADLNTGLIAGSPCSADLPIATISLPVYEANYAMLTGTYPFTNNYPNVPAYNSGFGYSGQLIEYNTDTLVSNDTIFLCPGELAEIKADWQMPGVTYLWNTGAITDTINATSSGMYTVEVSNGCYTWYDTTYVNYSGVALDLGNDTTICSGQSLMLNSNVIGANYLWSTGEVTPGISVSSSGDFWLEVTVGNCVLRDTIQATFVSSTVNLGNDTVVCDALNLVLDATTPGATYLWSDGSTSPVLMVSSTGTYWVNVLVGSCSVSDTINVTLDGIILDLGPDVVLCAGDSLQLDVSSINGTYMWQDGSTSPSYTIHSAGTYWVEITGPICSYADTITVSYDNTTLDLGNDTAICENDSIVIEALLSGAIAYSWSDGSFGSSITVSNNGDYWVDVVDTFDCVLSDTISVQTISLPQIELGADTTLCTGEELVLTPLQSVDSLLWSDGSTLSSMTINSDEQVWLSVYENGCMNSDTINVEFTSPVFLSFNDTSVCAGEYLMIDLSAVSDSVLWQDGSSLPMHQIDSAGLYSVAAWNECGLATDEFYVEIDFDCFCALYVPNAFTPNDDGINDLFGVKTNCDPWLFELLIFDRWGELIFESNDPYDYWDGVYKETTKNDMFVWKVRYQFEQAVADEITKYGFVVVVK